MLCDRITIHIIPFHMTYQKNPPYVVWAAISGETAALLTPFLHLRHHYLIFLLKSIESLALLTHANWNLTQVSKSFLFPTGAFRGYQTPSKLTRDLFLISPLAGQPCHPLWVFSLQLTDIFIFPPLSLLPLSPSLLISLSLRVSIMFSQSRSPTPPCSVCSILSQINWWTIQLWSVCVRVCLWPWLASVCKTLTLYQV